MKKLLLSLFLICAPSIAFAQCNGVFGANTLCGSVAGGLPGQIAFTSVPGNLVVGTSTVTGGTNTRILFDNSGVLGEYTISGSGSVAMTTSPSFTTPTLGVAGGTSVALGGCTIGSNALCVSGTAVLTSNAAAASVVGPNGTTNPVWQIDASTASQAAGLKLTGAATGGTVALLVTDSGLNANLSVNGKGSGTITVGSTSTGAITLGGGGGGVVLSSALTYGGVALSNAVTGTGNMVLSASPTFSGTIGGAVTFSGALTLSSALTYGGVTLSNSVQGTGSMVLATSPTLTTPNLGTPSAVTLTNGTGLPISGISSLGTNVATALGTNTGSASGFQRIIATGTMALGTSAITSATCGTATTGSATGIASTDHIELTFQGDPTATTGYLPSASVSLIPFQTANTINVKQCNYTGGSITPSALTINWVVLR